MRRAVGAPPAAAAAASPLCSTHLPPSAQEYVVTRWYRAPEVLLSGGQYSTAVDVWSAGCVLAELLLRRPLLPGTNYLHQLQLITELLGSPTAADLHFVRSEAARSFMLRLPQHAPSPLAALLPHVRGPVLDLLARMLAFDPVRRISVDDALAHPFLARVRAARRATNEEAPGVPRPFKLKVPGGSSGLRAMTVEAIKARFLAELIGGGGAQPAPAPALSLMAAAAPAAAATTSIALPPRAALPAAGPDDAPPADWQRAADDCCCSDVCEGEGEGEMAAAGERGRLE